jgi:hypothetical protein
MNCQAKKVATFMNLDDIRIVTEPLLKATNDEVDAMESHFGLRSPKDYRAYITTFGEGVLGGAYIRIYPPWRILNELQQWRHRIDQYWFWDDGSDVLTKQQALECIIIGDTLDGDEIIFHPRQPDHILILPRNSGKIYRAGESLLEAIEWLCSSGRLTEPFEEREFEPFNSYQA